MPYSIIDCKRKELIEDQVWNELSGVSDSMYYTIF